MTEQWYRMTRIIIEPGQMHTIPAGTHFVGQRALFGGSTELSYWAPILTGEREVRGKEVIVKGSDSPIRELD